MSAFKKSRSRSRFAVLGVLAFEPSTGYEIRKLLTETTSHFWKESSGQIYPTLDELTRENLIEVVSHETEGRETKRYRIRPEGLELLQTWIRSPDFQLRPGRHELLLKLFFARRDDVPWLRSQLERYAATIRLLLASYETFESEQGSIGLPEDATALIGTTIDFGLSAARMQLEWCERTSRILGDLEGVPASEDGPREARRRQPVFGPGEA